MANEDWAKDPTTRPEVLAMLSTSPSETVRLLVAQNPNTPETALFHLAKDDDDNVRKAIVHRAQVSSEVLKIASLPRELLAQLDAPEPQPSDQSTDQNTGEFKLPEGAGHQDVAAEESANWQQAPAPLPEPPAPARKPSIFAWFWRLFGRSA